MKIRHLACAGCAALLAGCGEKENTPLFTAFQYEGNDRIYTENPLAPDEFYNPILQGFYPDPSITRKGGDYYLAVSSFAYFPGVPLFHSTDLVNWRQVGHILDRPSQLPMDGSFAVRDGIYAPAITYNPHDDTFYMITTIVGGQEGGNFVVRAKDPAGDWSDPVWLRDVGGIDPSLFFDDDGQGYIVHNDAPDGEPLYEGHRAIRIWKYDSATDAVSGGQVIVNGGVDLAKKPIWIEAPHLYKRNGWYYLMCAEGGTAEDHSEVIFRSRNAEGPYLPAPKNPILTQRHLPAARPYPVTSAGHADIEQTPGGSQYGVFLACRPYRDNLYNTGRETFILPVDWSGDFPVFQGGLEPIGPKQKLPAGVENKSGSEGYMPNGNFRFTDDFRASQLDPRWMTLRTPDAGAVTTPEGLRLGLSAESIYGGNTPAFLAFRQQHAHFTASLEVGFLPSKAGEAAGLVCFQNEQYNYVFVVAMVGGTPSVALQRSAGAEPQTLAVQALQGRSGKVRLSVESSGGGYSFRWSENGGQEKTLFGDADPSILSTAVAQGFTGAVLGPYASTNHRVENIIR